AGGAEDRGADRQADQCDAQRARDRAPWRGHACPCPCAPRRPIIGAMDLVGAWLRQLLRAGTAAALVPLAIVAAFVVVVAGAGGLGGLGSLRQLVTGPEISPLQEVAVVAPRERDAVLIAPPALVAAAPPPAVAGPPPP